MNEFPLNFVQTFKFPSAMVTGSIRKLIKDCMSVT